MSSFRVDGKKWLLSTYRTLVGQMQASLKSGKCLSEEESCSDSLRCCTSFGRNVTVFCKATLPRVFMSDRKKLGLLGRKTSSGEHPL